MNRNLALGLALALFIASAATPLVSAQAADEQALQTLVNDAAFQFKLSYRDNRSDLAGHYAQLEAAVAAWNASARGDADDRRLAAWLREAIQVSMPGSTAELPTVPTFEPKPKPVAPSKPEELPSPSIPRGNPVTQASAETEVQPALPAIDTRQNQLPASTTPIRSEDENESGAPAEQTLLRPMSDATTAEYEWNLFSNDPGTEATDNHTTESVEDFWSSHPASDELPADLSSGDPFLDDPLPVE